MAKGQAERSFERKLCRGNLQKERETSQLVGSWFNTVFCYYVCLHPSRVSSQGQ